MKKLLLALALALAPVSAWAQCTGVFPANTLCGNLTGSPAPPAAFAASGTITGPASSIIGDIATFANVGGTQVQDSNVSLASQSAKLFLATPTGSAGVPAFRSLVYGDLPAFATSFVLGNFSGSTNTPSAQPVATCANDGFHFLSNNAGGGFNCVTVEPITSLTTTPQAIASCGTYWLGGNVMMSVTVGAASGFSNPCKLTFQNTDTIASGRGKKITVNGITAFWLYPGQTVSFRGNATSWVPEQQLNGQFGLLWTLTAAHFYVDNSGSNTNNDGLAAGAGGAFATKAYCAQVAQAQIYTSNSGSVQCSSTAGMNAAEFVQVFYPLSGGGTLIFNSATPGTQTTWTCPSSSYCLQFGDGALVGLTDIAMSMNPSSLAAVTGHQFGVLDVNTNDSFAGASTGAPIFTCDYDTHWNINNGLNYSGSWQFIYNGCQNSSWNINGAHNAANPTTLGRTFNFQTSSSATIQGNVTWGVTGLTTSVGLVSGNSVLVNLGPALPGGAPTPTTGGQYCTTTC